MITFEKFSKAMLKRNKGVPLMRVISQSDQSKYIAAYLNIKQTYSRNLNSTMQNFQNGIITQDEYEAQQQSIIKTAFTGAFKIGKEFGSGDDTLTPDESRFISQQMSQEMGYMRNFASDIASGSGQMPYQRRMQMYSDSLDSMFGFGKLTYLPEDVQIIWRLGPTDKHCIDCLVFAANSPYTKRTLPGFPKSGHSQCLSNCLCQVSYIYKNNITQDDYHKFLLSGKSFDASKSIPTETDYQHMMGLRDEFYYNRGMFEMTKDKSYQDKYQNAQTQFQTYKKSNNLYFPVYFKTREAMNDIKEFKQNALFETIMDKTKLNPGDVVSVFTGNVQSYMIIDSITNGNPIGKSIEGIIQILDPSKQIIFKEK